MIYQLYILIIFLQVKKLANSKKTKPFFFPAIVSSKALWNLCILRLGPQDVYVCCSVCQEELTALSTAAEHSFFVFFFSFLPLNLSLYLSRKTFRDLLKSYSPIMCLKHHGPFFCRTYLLFLSFSRSVLSDSLGPHELQHTRLPCPSLSTRVCSNSCPLSR